MASERPVSGQVAAGGFLLLLGVWLARSPYNGIWHDSILYTVGALRILHPAAYAHDLFFAQGSQAGYTVFPALYAAVIRVVGVDAAALILTLAGKLLWFGTLVFACRGFLRGKVLWLGLAVCVSASPYYGYLRIFQYGESFLTGRLYAEALVLLALGLFLRGRSPGWWLAAAALAVAAHPLMAIPGVALLAILAFLRARHRAWLALGYGVAGVAVLAVSLTGRPPLGDLWHAFDPEWLTAVRTHNFYVFVSAWDLAAWARAGLLAVILLMAARLGDPVVRQLAQGLLATGGLLLAVSWLGSALLHNVLLTQLQLWRVLWLVQLLAMALMGRLLLSFPGGTPRWRLLVILVACAVTVNDLLSSLPVLIGVGFFLSQQFRRLAWLRPRIVFVAAFAALVASARMTWILMGIWQDAGRTRWMPVFFNPLLVIGVVLVLLWYGTRVRSAPRWPFALGLAACILGSWAFADRGRLVDPPPSPALIHALQARIPVGATVYRIGGIDFDWVHLRRAHYMDEYQGVNVLFSRATVAEVNQRTKRLASLGLPGPDPHSNWGPAVLRAAIKLNSPSVTEGLRVLCADPALDYVILTDVPGESTAIAASFVYEQEGTRLYSCVRVRQLVEARHAR